MANVSKLLNGPAEEDSFLKRLNPLPKEVELLKSVRKDIRTHLRLALGGLAQRELGITLGPRFFTQGSFAYGTLNRRPYPLEMDMDDGVYLPMSLMQGAKPSKAASAYFKIVDSALKQLADKNGWEQEPKDTCSRVIVNKTAHFDVPLYAIPDADFKTLVEKRNAAVASFDTALDEAAYDDRWDALPPERVLLAHRVDNWKASDPRPIHEWFTSAVDLHGELLRRECRYLKAWRDYNHVQIGELSSIMLMAAAWMVFQEMGRINVPRRDDQALLEIAARLPDLLKVKGKICNPTDNSEPLDGKLDANQRKAAIAAAEALSKGLHDTVTHCYDQHKAVETMQLLFGDRIPNRPDLVTISAAAQTVRATPATVITALPPVGRSSSG